MVVNSAVLDALLESQNSAAQVLQDYEKTPEQVDFRDPTYLKKATDRMPDLGRKVCSFQAGQLLCSHIF